MQFSFSGSDFWLGVENNVTAFKQPDLHLMMNDWGEEYTNEAWNWV